MDWIKRYLYVYRIDIQHGVSSKSQEDLKKHNEWNKRSWWNGFRQPTKSIRDVATLETQHGILLGSNVHWQRSPFSSVWSARTAKKWKTHSSSKPKIEKKWSQQQLFSVSLRYIASPRRILLWIDTVFLQGTRGSCSSKIAWPACTK